jgi:hypothetical protein
VSKTTTIRVPEAVHNEVRSAARMFGCTPAELLERAWSAYRDSPEFAEDLSFFQKAVAAGDFGAITARLQERSRERAHQRAAAVEALRSD